MQLTRSNLLIFNSYAANKFFKIIDPNISDHTSKPRMMRGLGVFVGVWIATIRRPVFLFRVLYNFHPFGIRLPDEVLVTMLVQQTDSGNADEKPEQRSQPCVLIESMS